MCYQRAQQNELSVHEVRKILEEAGRPKQDSKRKQQLGTGNGCNRSIYWDEASSVAESQVCMNWMVVQNMVNPLLNNPCYGMSMVLSSCFRICFVVLVPCGARNVGVQICFTTL